MERVGREGDSTSSHVRGHSHVGDGGVAATMFYNDEDTTDCANLPGQRGGSRRNESRDAAIAAAIASEVTSVGTAKKEKRYDR